MSRLTFRDKASDIAWQKQLRDKYLAEGTPPVPHLDVKQAIVRPVSRRLAEQVILKYEWLGTMAQTNLHYGIFFGSYCAGVCCAGSHVTGGTNTHLPFRIFPDQLLVLARGACVHWSPVGANSKLVSWTCKLMARNTNAKLVIAYSDTDAGEIGTIYQACNWICIGKGSATNQWVAPNGRVYDQKYPSDLRRNQGKRFGRSEYTKLLRENGYTEQRTNPKYRYVYILDRKDKALVDRVEAMRQPYPKREHADA
jgi:hypothetical protein